MNVSSSELHLCSPQAASILDPRLEAEYAIIELSLGNANKIFIEDWFSRLHVIASSFLFFEEFFFAAVTTGRGPRTIHTIGKVSFKKKK